MATPTCSRTPWSLQQRPLHIFLLANKLHRPTKAFQDRETRSVFPNLSCREIVDGTYCFCQSRLIGNLCSQRDHFLSKLCLNLGQTTAKLHTRCETCVSRASPQTMVLWHMWCLEHLLLCCSTKTKSLLAFPTSDAPIELLNCPPRNMRRATIQQTS